MNVLAKRWQAGYLDEALRGSTSRIQVWAFANVCPAAELFFVRKRSLKLLFNYTREIGLRYVAAKIKSRLAESLRNEKYVSVGLGTVVEAAGALTEGNTVVFVAPAHPRCVERIVLHDSLVWVIRPAAIERTSILHLKEGDTLAPLGAAADVAGWSDLSGESPPGVAVKELLTFAEGIFGKVRGGIRYPVGPSEIAECHAASGPSGKKPSAVLFGYGNYAKSVLIPNVLGDLDLRCVHELDPTQLPLAADWSTDTSALPRHGEKYDVYLVAGYHHTHAQIAAHALRAGSVAVVEKPIATTRDELGLIVETLERTGGRFFACFQKRFSPFSAFARKDMGISPGTPISYHAIVYEVPFPALHWYRWPNSRSRIVSNACHWIDHFAFMNDFIPARRVELTRTRDDTVNVTVELENDAVLTLAVTDKGSERVGLREYVELRAGDATVSMSNASSYKAETSTRVVRQARINRMRPYALMYKAIARAICRGEPGDSIDSIQIPTEIMLDLEDQLQSQRR